ncbi:hypothetical protein HF086_002396 [Spodoptera exigua]|uniref:Amino acid transporter transmembrane domain-containing protein n=1 Tax=Spodoptera exigua TaxID=7107 RepID=A0A922SFG5_SPOEX|nr:hypothetical protein HF086_002396 [Spodoptera exigua]
MAYFNIIRTLFGPGVLIMPLAISQAGIILGPILGLCYGLLLVHTHIMLLNSLNEIARQLKIPYVSYRYGFRLAVLHGPPLFQCIGKHGPTALMILSLYLISVSFAYPIQCYPAIAVIIEVIKYHDPMAVPDNKMLKRLEIFGRPLFVLLTCKAAFEQVSRMTVRPYQTDRTIDIRRTRLPSMMPEDDDYDPKEHRSPTHNIK